MASGFKDRPLAAETLVLGEVGLAGEIRAVTQVERRLEEAARLGFRRFLIPAGNKSRLKAVNNCEVYDVRSVAEALETGLMA
jgi:DNA repair protein RadA/Sms